MEVIQVTLLKKCKQTNQYEALHNLLISKIEAKEEKDLKNDYLLTNQWKV